MKKRITNIILVLCLSMLTSCGQSTDVEEMSLPIVEDEPHITDDTSDTTTVESSDSSEGDSSDDVWTAFNTIISSPRTRGTEGEILARDYLKSQLELANYDVEIQPFDFYEYDMESNSVDFFNLNPYNSDSLGTAYNIIAQKDYDPDKKTIIFSAHYDSTKDSIGAFDNGSGTAVILEAAKLISSVTANLDYNIRIILFSCEEYFLTGSKYYVSTLTDEDEEKNNILGCFNLDMVGNSIARDELYYGNQGETSPFIQELIRLSPQFENTNIGSSDDYPFYLAGIPSFTMTTVNFRDSNFNPEVLDLEIDNKYITEEFLIKDAQTVVDFMKNVNIHNLVEVSPPSVEEEIPPIEEETPSVEEEIPPIEEEIPPTEEEIPPIEEEIPPIEEETPPIEEETPSVEGDVIAPTVTTSTTLPSGALSDWNLILLNHGAENKIDGELNFTKVKFDSQYVDSRAGEYYQKMYDAALKEGITLYLRSGYRSISTQTVNYNANVQRIQNQGYSYDEAVRQTNLYYTVPGHSEHHTGLAFDIITPQYHNDVYTLNEQFATTTAYSWLVENCADYGFILRYAQDKTDLTQINFEPWHYRYVGVDHARYITDNNLCFEEYIQLLKSDGR